VNRKVNSPSDRFSAGAKVIVKPTDSAGSAGVLVCDTKKCMEDQINNIFGPESSHKGVRLTHWNRLTIFLGRILCILRVYDCNRGIFSV
jgi:hypothetical protein